MGITRTAVERAETNQPGPLPFLSALGIFLALGIWSRVCIHNITPFLEDRGMHQFTAYMTGFMLGLAALPLVIFVMLKREGGQWPTLSKRLGFRRFNGRHLLLMLGLTAVSFVVTQLLGSTHTWITDLTSWFEPGRVFLPLQDPTNSADSLIDGTVDWMGPDAAGNWLWGIMIVAMFVLNIVGEELLWRGVLWPRQEAVHGERTWLVHGFMWYLFHLPFYPWFAISGLPSAFILPYLYQKTKNMWLVLIMHTIFNAGFYAILLLIVTGVID